MTQRRNVLYATLLAALAGLLSVLLIAVGAPAHAGDGVAAPNGAAGKDYSFSFTHNGAVRNYRVFVPTTVSADPGVLVFLHGDGMAAGKAESANNLDINAGKKGYYVVWPDGLSGSWNAGVCCPPSSTTGVDDVGFLDQVLERVKLTYAVDPGKLAVAGSSGGGLMAFRYACYSHSVVQTIMPALASALSADCTTLPRKYKVLAVNGGADIAWPWENATPSFSSRVQMDRFSTLDGCDGTWTVTTATNGVQTRIANSCASPAAITQYLAPNLTHTWTSTSLQATTYGINITATYGSYLDTNWGRTPASPLTVPGPLPSDSPSPTPTDSTSPSPTPTDSTSPSPTPAPTIGPAVFAGTRVAPNAAAGTDMLATITVGTLVRQFAVFVPTKPAARPGLVVMMSDFGVTADSTETTSDLDTIAGQKGNYVVYAEGTLNPAWNAGFCCGYALATAVDDVSYLDAVIDAVQSRYATDVSRLALAGLGNGGDMAYRYACAGHHPVNAIGAVGALAIVSPCTKTPSMHVISINGLKDGFSHWTTVNNIVVYLTPQPSGRDALTAFAPTLGCSSTFKSSIDSSTGNTKLVATCPAGTNLEQTVVPWLGHAWTSKSSDWSTSGMNATVTVWNFFNRYWT